ncbi:hypothetical protein BHE74_00025187 [Ensete ventricosum]|nr:hypothetical protein GW17_00036421 [Ensete ventricosum]RWW67372.1 hypothetical protein BHE74_00025187 [Ensete ventricosum]RZS06264.1 hypothetical protein BHM03_00036892 [Ensete ventricosum]
MGISLVCLLVTMTTRAETAAAKRRSLSPKSRKKRLGGGREGTTYPDSGAGLPPEKSLVVDVVLVSVDAMACALRGIRVEEWCSPVCCYRYIKHRTWVAGGGIIHTSFTRITGVPTRFDLYTQMGGSLICVSIKEMGRPTVNANNATRKEQYDFVAPPTIPSYPLGKSNPQFSCGSSATSDAIASCLRRRSAGASELGESTELHPPHQRHCLLTLVSTIVIDRHGSLRRRRIDQVDQLHSHRRDLAGRPPHQSRAGRTTCRPSDESSSNTSLSHIFLLGGLPWATRRKRSWQKHHVTARLHRRPGYGGPPLLRRRCGNCDQRCAGARATTLATSHLFMLGRLPVFSPALLVFVSLVSSSDRSVDHGYRRGNGDLNLRPAVAAIAAGGNRLLCRLSLISTSFLCFPPFCKVFRWLYLSATADLVAS